MDSQELRSLMEAYVQVHGENLQEGDASKKAETEFHQDLDSLVHKTFGASPEEKKKEKVKKEELDIFDVVLEFLQAEGYAETLEEAEWLMANMIDEEAIGIILGEAIYSEKGKAKAAEMIAKRSTPSGRAKSGKGANVAQIRQIRGSGRGRFDREGLGGTPMTPTMAKNPIKKHNYDGTGNKAARRAAALRQEDYVNEAQAARNNPEKYEREQAKKSAPVRGERTPMPPRGDKRREDFEKWYAKNVREEMTPEQRKARAARLDYKDEVRAARRAWIKKVNKGRPEYEGVKEAYQDPKFSRKDYLAKLQKRGGMGMGTKEDPHGYRDPKMAKVGAEFSKRVTAAHKARKSGEPDAYRAEKEGQSKKK
jgi:hypothetical protein